MTRPPTWLVIAAIVAVALAANAALLDDFWRLAHARNLAVAGSDIATHYLRMLQAREMYLASGHRLGWDPYWFQGYVPFLLYPHLTYVGLALFSFVVPLDPERLFNLYILAIYFALPLCAGLSILRSLGAISAVVLTSWFAVLSTTGAGLTCVFVIGLLSQQVGVVLFTLLAVDLVVTRRLDRAAIWLGLIPLVHVHASLIAAVAWIFAGGAALSGSLDRKGPARSWFVSSVVATLIALPTIVGLVYGWGDIGGATIFPEMGRLFSRLLEGTLLVPQPTIVAIGICLLAVPFVTSRGDRGRFLIWWCPLTILLFAVSVHKWSVGLPVADRIFGTMLYVRTLPFAFAWAAILAIWVFSRLPSSLRAGVLAVSLLSVIFPTYKEGVISKHIGSIWRAGANQTSRLVPDYRGALKWISRDAGQRTATLALAVPRPRAPWLFTAIDRSKQPQLGGHGIELTSVLNQDVVTKTLVLSCEQIGRQIHDYAVGYIVGTSNEQRLKLESCLRRPASYEQGAWWVLSTGKNWDTTPASAAGFAHDRTWTNLEWKLQPLERNTSMRLPVARNSQWIAEVDGQPVEIETTDDRMMRVTIPPGSETLRLHYRGYAGEWSTVGVSIAALLTAAARARRNTIRLNLSIKHPILGKPRAAQNSIPEEST